MNDLLAVVFSQSDPTHIDLFDRRELLEKNLSRIFADQGVVKLWEHGKERNAISQPTFSSAEAFQVHHVVFLVYKDDVGKAMLIDSLMLVRKDPRPSKLRELLFVGIMMLLMDCPEFSY